MIRSKFWVVAGLAFLGATTSFARPCAWLYHAEKRGGQEIFVKIKIRDGVYSYSQIKCETEWYHLKDLEKAISNAKELGSKELECGLPNSIEKTESFQKLVKDSDFKNNPSFFNPFDWIAKGLIFIHGDRPAKPSLPGRQ